MKGGGKETSKQSEYGSWREITQKSTHGDCKGYLVVSLHVMAEENQIQRHWDSRTTIVGKSPKTSVLILCRILNYVRY